MFASTSALRLAITPCTPLRGLVPQAVSLPLNLFPRNIANIKKHVAMNHLANVTVVEVAVSDFDGVSHFDCGGSAVAGHLSADGGLAVRTISLGHEIDCAALPEPDYIKIDAEGAELRILRSCRVRVVCQRAGIRHSPWRPISGFPSSPPFARIAFDFYLSSATCCRNRTAPGALRIWSASASAGDLALLEAKLRRSHGDRPKLDSALRRGQLVERPANHGTFDNLAGRLNTMFDFKNPDTTQYILNSSTGLVVK